MIIGVMSDSHDNLPMIRAGLKRLEAEGAEVLLHAGDFISPFAVRALMEFPHRVVGVFGNNDGEKRGITRIWAEVCDPPRVLRLADRDVLMVHDRAKPVPQGPAEADILIHGHTHEPEVKKVKQGHAVLCVNPGECGGWLSGVSTVAVIDTERLEARIIEIGCS